MLTDEYLEKLAFKVVPKGSERTRSQLRKAVAELIRAEVEQATERQREEQFPELKTLHAEARKRAELAEKEQVLATQALRKQTEQLAREREAVVQREKAVAQREKDLSAFMEAFNNYDQWLNGAGEVDENGKRFDALRVACAKLKEKRT